MLRIVADAVRDNGQCLKTIPEIAARAGVCRTTVQNAIRLAARQGLLVVQERRRPGRKSPLEHCPHRLHRVADVDQAR